VAKKKRRRLLMFIFGIIVPLIILFIDGIVSFIFFMDKDPTLFQQIWRIFRSLSAVGIMFFSFKLLKQ